MKSVVHSLCQLLAITKITLAEVLDASHSWRQFSKLDGQLASSDMAILRFFYTEECNLVSSLLT